VKFVEIKIWNRCEIKSWLLASLILIEVWLVRCVIICIIKLISSIFDSRQATILSVGCLLLSNRNDTIHKESLKLSFLKTWIIEKFLKFFIYFLLSLEFCFRLFKITLFYRTTWFHDLFLPIWRNILAHWSLLGASVILKITIIDFIDWSSLVESNWTCLVVL